jgi:cell division protein FtsN
MVAKLKAQHGRFFPGFLVGLLIGLVLALGVALYVSKVPSPFVDKVPTHSAEQDAADAEKNRNWDPNAPLSGKSGSRAATGSVSSEPSTSTTETAATPGPAASSSTARAADLLGLKPATESSPEASGTSAKSGPGTLQYYVQIGAYTRTEDAEQQRAKLAISGLTGRITERDQSGRTVYRVRLGPFNAREDAEAARDQASAVGYPDATLVPVLR